MCYNQSQMEKILAKAMEDPEVMAVILFGSQARGDATTSSDYDLCLVLCPGEYTGEYLFQKRLGYLALGAGDVHIFSQLPLYIRQRVLKGGECFYARMKTNYTRLPSALPGNLKISDTCTASIWRSY